MQRSIRGVATGWFVALGALVAPAGAFAADPVGPAIGNNRYRGTISAADDQDDFTGQFLDGERLTVVVTAAGKGKSSRTLRPVLSLVDPDGIVRTAGIVSSHGGAGTQLRNFPIDKSGPWAARIASGDGTTGDFNVAFQVRPAARHAFRRQAIGGDAPLSRTYDFSAFEGAVLDAAVTYTAKSRPVEIRSLADPDGSAVPDGAGGVASDAAVRKGRKVELKGVVLAHGTGTYRLTVSIPTGTATCDVLVSLHAPARPGGRKPVVLSAAEPAIDAVTEPTVGEPGTLLRVRGANFSAGPVPTVRFGGVRSRQVTVGNGGTTLDAEIPPRAGDAVVPLYVINPDGQGAARDAYFAYLPPPVVYDLRDTVTGALVRSASASGGRAVRLIGANFEAGQTVRFGDTVVSPKSLVSGTEFRFLLPAVLEGSHALSVTDAFGRSATSSFTVFCKVPPAFDASPYSPGAVKVNAAATITISGSGFSAADRLVFAGQDVASTFVDATTRTFDIPALPAGSYSVRLVDSIGTAVDGPPLPVKDPPTITSVSVVAGPVLGATEIPLRGGSTIRVDGTNFAWNDAVTLGGAAGTVVQSASTSTRKEFVAPAGSPGLAALSITDGAGQSVSAADVVRFVGLTDTTSKRLPAPSFQDDLSAVRGATGDLDRDGLADDVVLVSPFGASHGSRLELTRVLIGDASGKLADKTTTAMTAVRMDGAHVDSWDATCVAVGDIDGANGPDIVIAGEAAQGGTYRQVRLFRNGGSATFSLDETLGPVTRYAAPVYGYYYYGYYIYQVYSATAQAGTPQAIALGDLDKDGDLDVVLGTDASAVRQVYIDPSYVDFTTTPPTISYPAGVSYRQYVPATRVLLNGISSGGRIDDATLARLPLAGTSKNTAAQPPAFHCRDLAVADIDMDGTLDIVVTWDDPATVTAYGLSTFLGGGTSLDTAHVATQVLLNSSKSPGTFTDATATWMPAGSTPEYWQANRMALGDLDGDGDPDLVLVASKGLDAWTGTETHTNRALRVLRNDRTKFTDVTGTAVPAVDANLGDDWRGDAVTIRDVDGDGRADVLVATRSALTNSDGSPARRLRLLTGSAAGGIVLAASTPFCEKPQTDTGDADHLLFVGDLGGAGKQVLLLLAESAAAATPSSARARAEEWKR